MTKQDLLKVYAYTQAVLGSFKIPTEPLESQTTALVWLKFLKPYPLDIIYSAIDHYAKENNFINISRVAELCKDAQDIRNGTHASVETFLKEIEVAIDKASTYETANTAYNNLSDFCKALIPGYWTLGRWHNEGFEYSATRIKQQILDKLRTESMQKSMQANAQLLSTQNQYNSKLLEANDD